MVDLKGNNSITMSLHGVRGMLMGIEISAFHAVEQQYRIDIFDTIASKHIYEGNLQETIELILLGKTYRNQLKAEAKTTCSS